MKTFNFNFLSLPSFGGDESKLPEVSMEALTPSVLHNVDLILDRTNPLIEAAKNSDPGFDMPPAQAAVIEAASHGTRTFVQPPEVTPATTEQKREAYVAQQDLRQASANIIEQAAMEDANEQQRQADIREYIDRLYDETRG